MSLWCLRISSFSYSTISSVAKRVRMLSRSILVRSQFPRCTPITPTQILLTDCALRYRVTSPGCRIFTTTPRHRKDATRIPQPQSTIGRKADAPESVKPESVQPVKSATPSAASRQDASYNAGLLSEKTVSNAQQRKADWAIMREMTQYLWPKVYQLKPG